MKRAAIGVRAHSGWGAVVAVSARPASVEILDRRRVAVTDESIAGANQPYHFAKRQTLPDAERYLADGANVSERLAVAALADMVDGLRRRGYVVGSCAILVASGRELPSLPRILASHALIHTAEGEFFRRAFRQASERLGIPVVAISERELDPRAEAAFGPRTLPLQQEIAALGRSLGPPWTADQKNASLAALLALAGERHDSAVQPV